MWGLHSLDEILGFIEKLGLSISFKIEKELYGIRPNFILM